MRNLKRALSLLLSSTMVLGMVVMGGSAAGYQDVDDTYHKEAIEVLQAAGIMTGVDSAGNFNPEGTVTRNEMAVIMSNLMAYNVATYSGTSPFTDVPDWAEPYVAACWTNGITAGTSETTYGGDQTVTTAQAALMIMKALGYFQYQSDFGSDWQLSTVSQGNKIDLFTDVNSGVKEAMTRNDVAQLVLNGLESGTVQAETSGTITVGDITIVNDVKYNLITSGEKYAFAINDALTTSNDGTVSTGSIVELGEKLYLGDLAKKRDVDDFGRPSNVWSYNSNEIGTYADEATYTHNTKVTSKALYNEVGSIAASDYKWHVTYNGKETSYTGADLVANKTENDTDFVAKALGGIARTGTGVLTEVYVNNVDKEVYVAIVDTFVGEVTKVEDEAVTIKQFDGDANHQAPKLDSKKFETTDSGLAVGDIVLYTVSGSEIMSLQKAESVTGTLTAYQAKDPNNTDTNANKDSYAKLDDTQYTYAVQMVKNLEDNTDFYPMGLNNEYVFYLDTFGNLIAFKGIEVIDNYLYVENAVASAAGVSAKVRFADGVQKVIDVSEVKGNNAGASFDDASMGSYGVDGKVQTKSIYTYSEENGMYRLTALAQGTGVGEYQNLVNYTGTAYDFDDVNDNDNAVGQYAYGIKQGHSRIFPVTIGTVAADPVTGNDVPTSWVEDTSSAAVTNSYAVDSTTIFVDLETGEVFTGYENVPSYSAVNAQAAFGKNGVADVVFIYNQRDKSNSGVYFFVKGDSRETWESNNITYRKYEVYIDGAKQELTTKDFVLSANSLYKQIQVNADGQLVDADLVYDNIDAGDPGDTDSMDAIISSVNNNATGAHQATSIANNTLVLAAADANQGGKSIFNWNDKTVFVNIETKYDSTGAVVVDNVDLGSANDIDVVNNPSTTAVYVVSVNDKTNAAPTAQLVYIVTKPDADALATVTVSGTANAFKVDGSAVPSGTYTASVVKGLNKSITIAADTGFKITGVTVGTTPLIAQADGTYVYSAVVNDDVNITVTTEAVAPTYTLDVNTLSGAYLVVNGNQYLTAGDIDDVGETVLVDVVWPNGTPAYLKSVTYGGADLTPFSSNGNTDTYMITLNAGDTLDVQKLDSYSLTLPANVTATWAAQGTAGGYGAGSAADSTTTQVPAGATVALSGSAVVSTSYLKADKTTEADEYVKAGAATFTMDDTVTVDSALYYKVIGVEQDDTANSGLTINVTTTSDFVKAGDTVEYTIEVVGSATKSGTITISNLGGIASASATDGTAEAMPTNWASGSVTSGSMTITVTAAASTATSGTTTVSGAFVAGGSSDMTVSVNVSSLA